MYLKEGDSYLAGAALQGMMLSSGNDAAVALAIYCGTVEGFAALMNDKARRLTGTHFEIPTVWGQSSHYSTAKDLGTLAAYAMENPFLQDRFRQKCQGEGIGIENHNKLLWRVKGADG